MPKQCCELWFAPPSCFRECGFVTLRFFRYVSQVNHLTANPPVGQLQKTLTGYYVAQ